VRLIWWDDKVRSEQVFKRGQYDTLAQALQPVGGGGTSPQVVTQYVQEKKYKLSGAIWLTDGYLDAKPTRVCSNELWGVFNNDFFKPAHGKVLRIHA
jgi:predicted metal-dependent peptidase